MWGVCGRGMAAPLTKHADRGNQQHQRGIAPLARKGQSTRTHRALSANNAARSTSQPVRPATAQSGARVVLSPMPRDKTTGGDGAGDHIVAVPQTLGLAQSVRRRAITRRFDETYAEWEATYESAVGNFAGWPQRCRLRQAFAFWPATGCELCTCFLDYAAADDHVLEECTRWEESPRAKHLLRLLSDVAVEPAPEEKDGAIDEVDDVPCMACGFASKPCAIDHPPEDPEAANCRNVEMARRAVAALLAFEDGVLVDGLVEETWAEDDDVAAMQAYMAEQEETDRSYIPGILQTLDDLYGSYQYLVGDYDYRANLRSVGKATDVAILPRCRDGKFEFVEDKLNAEIAAKEQRMAAIEKQLDEEEGEDDDEESEEDDAEDDDYDPAAEDDSENDEDWQDDESEDEDRLDNELVQLEFDIERLERWRPINQRLTELQRRLLNYRDVCMTCKMAGRQSSHSIRTCNDEKAQKAKAELVWAERAINFSRNLGCLRCGVPSQICSRWEEEERGGELFRLTRLSGRCCFEGVALETIYGFKYGCEPIWNTWLNRLEGKNVQVRRTLSLEQAGESLMTYLGKRNDDDRTGDGFSNPSSNNLIWEFEWITQMAEKRGMPRVK